MPRSYRHMQDYEKEIMELREQGLNRSERSSVLSIMRNIKKILFCAAISIQI